jgi:cell wall-associated NlpC family hydrolase
MLGVACAQDQDAHPAKPPKGTPAAASHGRKHGLSADERRSVITVALDSKKSRSGGRDCSHLVHSIYQRAGFPYAYADSDDLYAGAEGFQRVPRPQAGDLVVWPGHAGIVIRPSRHTFFSFLSRGPGIDDYHSRYWRGRGVARFYRYVKGDGCAGCTIARGHAE